MTQKIVKAAIAAQKDGYEFLYSVVKQVFRTTYYHVVPIEWVIERGKWIPAPAGSWPTKNGNSSWHGRAGTATLPEHSINKSVAIARYCKETL